MKTRNIHMQPDIDELTVNVKTYTGETLQLKLRVRYDKNDNPIVEYSFFDEDDLQMPHRNISPENWSGGLTMPDVQMKILDVKGRVFETYETDWYIERALELSDKFMPEMTYDEVIQLRLCIREAHNHQLQHIQSSDSIESKEQLQEFIEAVNRYMKNI